MSTLLPDILRTRAAGEPDRRAYVFVDEDGAETAELTYATLHKRALAVAAGLARHCAPGDRALLLFPQCLDFIVAYFGCLYAGVVAVPVNPPRRNRVQEATRSVVRDCEPAAALTLSGLTGLAAMKSEVDSLVGGLAWLAVDEVPDAQFTPFEATPDSLAFLQYTSGSTSQPKGVMVAHGNLVANQAMIRHGFGHDAESTVVGWAPFFHDQGLIGNVLQPLYVGATSILMPPGAFIRRPALWLSTISRYRAHTSGGPNFAYDACVAQAARTGVPADLDLSCWRVAFNGAEPIRPETLSRFSATFGPAGFAASAFYPCYGLAEATLIVTGSRKDRGPRTLAADPGELGHGRLAEQAGGRELAGSGTVLPGEEVRIVAPGTRTGCAPGEVGEIWVAGDHVAQGYWKRSEATEETFRARCAGSDREFLRTGDLGVFAGEELHVVGRIKDLIIVRGRNHYPHDVEHTVEAAHPAVRPGAVAAFAVPGGDTEKVVVVAEIRREHRHDADPAEVTGAIRAAVTREHDLALGALVLTRHGELPKTSSGKLKRAEARTRHLAGSFARWPPDPERTPKMTELNPDFAQAVTAVVLSMPAAKHLGFAFGRIERGEVEIVQPWREELSQHNGFFQGGVLGSLADFAAGSAAGTLLPAGWVNMTVDYTVKLVAPAKGEKVIARGRVVKAGTTMTVAAADLFSVAGDEETLCATALVTMRNVKLPQG
ncbi:AMP-binding protein [Amycolatopsis sp. NPDC051903]|uniref:AMP-binding protein n=1 Tax=Amycolatopsis sp. NPDC051903 TaxID=3363936 RepID=UPI0037BD9B1E